MSITLNTKVFDVTERPSTRSVILTTRSRGATLPDTILLDYRTKKNPVEAGSLNRVHKISIQRTFINADGVVKVGGISLQFDLPDDMDQSNIDGLQADLTDFMASAITLRTANIAIVQGGILQ
jgi:hypothetical protein